MRTLIVYYSMEGNTDYMANRIAGKADADLLRIEPVKAYHDKGFLKFVWGGKSAVMGEKPELKPYDADLSAYDRVIFGSPVWAANITPPLRTFIEDNKEALDGKKFAAFVCEAGSGGEKALEKLGGLIGHGGADVFDASVIFIDPKNKPSEKNEKKLEVFLSLLGE